MNHNKNVKSGMVYFTHTHKYMVVTSAVFIWWARYLQPERTKAKEERTPHVLGDIHSSEQYG